MGNHHLKQDYNMILKSKQYLRSWSEPVHSNRSALLRINGNIRLSAKFFFFFSKVVEA